VLVTLHWSVQFLLLPYRAIMLCMVECGTVLCSPGLTLPNYNSPGPSSSLAQYMCTWWAVPLPARLPPPAACPGLGCCGRMAAVHDALERTLLALGLAPGADDQMMESMR
jgi:hypothetical protein